MNSAAKGEGVLVEDEEGSLEMWEAMMLCTGDDAVLESFTDGLLSWGCSVCVCVCVCVASVEVRTPLLL